MNRGIITNYSLYKNMDSILLLLSPGTTQILDRHTLHCAVGQFLKTCAVSIGYVGLD